MSIRYVGTTVIIQFKMFVGCYKILWQNTIWWTPSHDKNICSKTFLLYNINIIMCIYIFHFQFSDKLSGFRLDWTNILWSGLNSKAYNCNIIIRLRTKMWRDHMVNCTYIGQIDVLEYNMFDILIIFSVARRYLLFVLTKNKFKNWNIFTTVTATVVGYPRRKCYDGQ